MTATALKIEPILTAADREELSHLEYLLTRLAELRDRGLIVEDSFATVRAESQNKRDTIERHGRYQAALAKAHEYAGKLKQPREALKWAELAAEVDPTRVEAWTLIVSLNWALERDDEAIARCAEAATRFPSFQAELVRLQSELAGRAEERRRKAEQAQQESDITAWLQQAKQALEQEHDGDAVALCDQVLALRPEHAGALAVAAYGLQRQGQLERAQSHYEILARLQPGHLSWSQWVRNIQMRRNVEKFTGKSVEPMAAAGDSATGAALPPPPLSWSSFAGEFLEEHWQKLILCLAVLLIVVGSTVGAGLLLGPLLWSPLGKCTIALIPTSLLALFGAGLMRWGADRAGRMLLIATLILVPIHFMLAGELKLLLEPTTSRLIVLGLDAGLLLALVRVVSGLLATRSGARFLTVTLMCLSIGSAATASGTSTAWNWQFAAFQAPAVVFLIAVRALGVWRWGTSLEDHRQYVYMMLGLLGFALVASLVRAGLYALRLEPPLYAVPIMMGAIALVHAARKLVPYEADPQHVAWLRLGGYALSGLAFALALARPPDSSTLFSGNLVATGLLGLGLYAASLRNTRQPAFLYFSVGALVVIGLGLRTFLGGTFQIIEEAVRVALQYSGQLPRAFRAILILIPNAALGLLSIAFKKYWNDRELARHCHYLGVPLSIAAGAWSCSEPLAGLICLSVYAILYLVAIWFFAAPWLTYLAIAALTGATYLGSTLFPAIHLADQALLAATLAVAFWAIRRLLQRFDVNQQYRTPWLHAALLLTAIALIAATYHLAFVSANSWTAAAAFLLVGILAVLWNREWPRTTWAWLTVASLVEFTICALVLATGGKNLPAHDFGLLFVSDALVVLAVAEGFRHLIRGRERLALANPDSASVDAHWAQHFLDVLPPSGIALTALADWLGLVDIGRVWTCGLLFLLGAVALLWTTRHLRRLGLVYLGLVHFVLGVMVLSSWAITASDPGMRAGWLALTAAATAFVLWATGVGARRSGLSEFYTKPCLEISFAATVGVFFLAIGARLPGRDAYQLATLALVANTVVTMLVAASWHRADLTYAGVFHFVTASYLVVFSVGKNNPEMAYVLGLVAVVEALVCWTIAFVCRRASHPWTKECGWPLDHWAIILTGVAVLLADRSPLVLGLVGLAFLLMVKSRPRVEWLYGTIAAVVAACHFEWFSTASRLRWMEFATLTTFVLWATGVLIQRIKPAASRRLGLVSLGYEFPLFETSILAAFIALLLRVDLSVEHGASWVAHGWLPACLSVLALLMLRAYPKREYVHLCLAFLTWSVVAAIAPSITSVCFLALAGTGLALALLVVERAVRPFESVICQRVGIVDAGYTQVVSRWVSSLFGLAALVATVVIVAEMGVTIFGGTASSLSLTSADWWAMLATLLLLGVFLVVEGTDPRGWIASEPEHVLIGLHLLSVSLLWWLGVECSPLATGIVTAGLYYPFATGMAALATAQLVRRNSRLEGWHELGWFKDLRSEHLARLLSYQTVSLSVLAMVFTRGDIEPKTVVTLILAAISLGLIAFEWGWLAAAAGASLAWATAGGLAAWVTATRLGYPSLGERATSSSVGLLLAAFALWALAGRLRRDLSILKGQPAIESSAATATRPALARAVEAVVLVASILAGVMVFAIGADPTTLSGGWTTAGIAVLVGVALVQILMVPRWQEEGLVYVAQAAMLAAYIRFRIAYPLPIASDAVILTLLGYLDLGIAEVIDRLHAKIYVRPTRYFALVLPILPFLQLVWTGGLTEISLFHLFAAGTFYGVACAQFQWKWLGYAAGVFYNVALWVLWSRMGWQFADNPQWYLVPVGLSTILFAEVNRHELGRASVNTIRSVGLMLIYLSLAMPVWQFASLGPWLILLLCSLAGVFVGIGLRVQTFLWMGLSMFVLDVLYQLGRVSVDHALAKWAIMLALGLTLVVFVALNEKKRIVQTMRGYYDQVRAWE